MSPRSLQRRQWLRAAGVSVGLPLFASLGRGESRPAKSAKPRMVCIGNMLGFYPDAFWPETVWSNRPDPKTAGKRLSDDLVESRDFQFGRTASSLDPLHDKLTVMSGLDHGIKGGHFAIHAFLSGVRQVDAKSRPMANITLDQYAAESVVGQTRFPTLTIGSETGIHGGCQLSWTRSGTRVPPIPGPQQLFEKLFVGTAAKDKAAKKQQLQFQGSILDLVHGGASDLKRKLNRQDQNKLDEYLTSVRDVEKRLQLRQNWVDVPKPSAPFDAPKNQNLVADLPLLYDLILLALQTDSTRIATLEIGGDFNPKDLDIKGGYHAFSHHGQRPEAIEALVAIEGYQIEQFARFVEKMAEAKDENGSLLEQTSILFGSGMGNANSHSNSNLPLVLAGGGFRHGRHLAYDPKSSSRPPLGNLFVSMLQNFGVETDQFATGTGTLRGLA